MKTITKKITKEQIKYIWILWRKHAGIDKEFLYDVMRFRFRKDSMRELSTIQASDLIDIIKNWGNKSTQPSVCEIPNDYRMTTAQFREINRRIKALKWSQEALLNWITDKKVVKHFDKDAGLCDLYPDEARFVIAGLEKIKKWNEKRLKSQG